ncbi:MAG: hypothetical protein HFJ75_07750 [Eggerthellaceae bacterium]|nr:hypothetical protein [Eggerthellaceae bacterium]
MEAPGYDFYANEYGGVLIAEEDWRTYAGPAMAYLARLTATCRVTPYAPDGRERAVCAAAEALHGLSEAEGRAAVRSASIGSVSTSYDATRGGAVDLTPKGKAAALLRAVSLYVHVFAGVR